MPVVMIEAGKTVTIVKITGSEKVRQHLSELGFVTGEDITVINNIGGNIILKVKDARIALDQDMARKIIVA